MTCFFDAATIKIHPDFIRIVLKKASGSVSDAQEWLGCAQRHDGQTVLLDHAPQFIAQDLLGPEVPCSKWTWMSLLQMDCDLLLQDFAHLERGAGNPFVVGRFEFQTKRQFSSPVRFKANNGYTLVPRTYETCEQTFEASIGSHPNFDAAFQAGMFLDMLKDSSRRVGPELELFGQVANGDTDSKLNGQKVIIGEPWEVQWRTQKEKCTTALAEMGIKHVDDKVGDEHFDYEFEDANAANGPIESVQLEFHPRAGYELKLANDPWYCYKVMSRVLETGIRVYGGIGTFHCHVDVSDLTGRQALSVLCAFWIYVPKLFEWFPRESISDMPWSSKPFNLHIDGGKITDQMNNRRRRQDLEDKSNGLRRKCRYFFEKYNNNELDKNSAAFFKNSAAFFDVPAFEGFEAMFYPPKEGAIAYREEYSTLEFRNWPAHLDPWHQTMYMAISVKFVEYFSQAQNQIKFKDREELNKLIKTSWQTKEEFLERIGFQKEHVQHIVDGMARAPNITKKKM
jgi:hypothetical protein